MLKGVIAGVLLTLIVGLIVAYALLESGRIPANADAAPGALEKWMARTSLRATMRREAPSEANPVALNEQNLLEGLRLYARNCAVCHGSAKGNAAASPIARGFIRSHRSLLRTASNAIPKASRSGRSSMESGSPACRRDAFPATSASSAKTQVQADVARPPAAVRAIVQRSRAPDPRWPRAW